MSALQRRSPSSPRRDPSPRWWRMPSPRQPRMPSSRWRWPPSPQRTCRRPSPWTAAGRAAARARTPRARSTCRHGPTRRPRHTRSATRWPSSARPSPTRGWVATCCAVSSPACCRCGTAPCSSAPPRSWRCGCSSSRAVRRCWSSRWWQVSWRSRSSCGSDRARWRAPRPTRRSTGATSSTTPTSSTWRATWRSRSARSSCWWPSPSSS